MPYNNHQFRSLRNRKEETVKCHQVATLCGEKWDNWLDIHRRVYGTDGLCPTIHCRIGGVRSEKSWMNKRESEN